MEEQKTVELQVARGRSIHQSTGKGIMKRSEKQGGGTMISPKRIIVYPELVTCSAGDAEFLLRTGVCIDPSQPVDEGAPVPGTTSTRFAGKGKS